MELVNELFCEQAVEHDAHQQTAATPREAFIAAVEVFRSAFPDNQVIIEDQIAEGDRVATRWRMTGAHQGEEAFYYLRVLEHPSCRWSSWDSIRMGWDSPRQVPATIQERAWSSPIWYRPHRKSSLTTRTQRPQQ